MEKKAPPFVTDKSRGASTGGSSKSGPKGTSKGKSTPPPMSTGDKLKLSTTASNSISGVVILTSVWPTAEVGVFVDIPFDGGELEREVIGRVGVYCAHRAFNRIYRTRFYGSFNPRAGKDGVTVMDSYYHLDSKGHPSSVRICFTAKGHKAGQILGNVLARLQSPPATSDLSSPQLEGVPRDAAILKWGASKFFDSLNKGANVVVIGGKKTSVKGSFIDKFEKKFKGAYKKPELTPISPPKGDIPPSSIPVVISVKLPKGTLPEGIVVASHVMSGFGRVGIKDDHITLSSTDNPSYVLRACAAALRSESGTAALLKWYETKSKRDAVGGVGAILACASISNGVPIPIAMSFLSSKSINVAKGSSSASEISDLAKDGKKK